MGKYNIPLIIDYEKAKDHNLLATPALNIDNQLFCYVHESHLFQVFINQLTTVLNNVLHAFSLPVSSAYDEATYDSDNFNTMVKYYHISTVYDMVVPFSFEKFKELLLSSKARGLEGVSEILQESIIILTNYISSFTGLYKAIHSKRMFLSRLDIFQKQESMTMFTKEFFHPDDVADFLDIIFLYSVYIKKQLTPIYNNDGKQVSIICRHPILLTSAATKKHNSFESLNPIACRSKLSILEFLNTILLFEQEALTYDVHMRTRSAEVLYKSMSVLITEYKNKKVVVEFTNPFTWT